jgi:hypothetical protein
MHTYSDTQAALKALDSFPDELLGMQSLTVLEKHNTIRMIRSMGMATQEGIRQSTGRFVDKSGK